MWAQWMKNIKLRVSSESSKTFCLWCRWPDCDFLRATSLSKTWKGNRLWPLPHPWWRLLKRLRTVLKFRGRLPSCVGYSWRLSGYYNFISLPIEVEAYGRMHPCLDFLWISHSSSYLAVCNLSSLSFLFIPRSLSLTVTNRWFLCSTRGPQFLGPLVSPFFHGAPGPNEIPNSSFY